MPDRPRLLLGAHFPGKEQVAWRHPDNSSMLDVDSYVRNARAADAANYHFLFLAESLSLAESGGKILSHTVNGRPDTLAMQTTLAAVTKTVGFVNTLNTTYNEPLDLARQLVTLDALSRGRAAWNLVTAAPPATAANFTRGDYLPYAQRYDRAQQFLEAVVGLWRGRGTYDAEGDHVTVRNAQRWPAPQQERPVLVQAGHSAAGREFATRFADAVYVIPTGIEAARETYRLVKDGLPARGRTAEDLKVVVGLRFVVGDTDDEAREKFEHYLDLEFSDADVVTEIERIWQRDLPGLDPDGPLPSVDPDLERLAVVLAKSPGAIRDPRAYVEHRRQIAAAGNLSCRQVVRRTVVRPAITGTPQTIADQIEHWLDVRAADGFIVQPQVVPLGTIEFAERVVPVLVERGLFRDHAPQQTLRDSLGLPASTY